MKQERRADIVDIHDVLTGADAAITEAELNAAPEPPRSEHQVMSDRELAATMAMVLTAAPPIVQMTNSTWRMLEEQKLNALETAREIADQIIVLEGKRNDALRVVAMAEAGQEAGKV